MTEPFYRCRCCGYHCRIAANVAMRCFQWHLCDACYTQWRICKITCGDRTPAEERCLRIEIMRRIDKLSFAEWARLPEAEKHPFPEILCYNALPEHVINDNDLYKRKLL